jgi:hypothetical protein
MHKPTDKMHFVPAFYLAGFTTEGSRDSKIHVFEPRTENHFNASVENVAFERGFYLVDPDERSPHRDPQYVESALSYYENLWAPIVQRVIERQELPDPRTGDLDMLVWLAALLSARTRKARRIWGDLAARDVRRLFLERVATPEAWQQTVSEGGSTLEGVSYEQAKQFAEEMVIKVGGKNQYAKNLFDDAIATHESLARRTWALIIADDSAPDFITSDSPGYLYWNALGNDVPLPLDRDMILDAGTTYHLPLTRRMALVGRFGKVSSGLMPTRYVALFNARTLLTCDRFIFSALDDFCVQLPPVSYNLIKGPVGVELERADHEYHAYLERTAREGPPQV